MDTSLGPHFTVEIGGAAIPVLGPGDDESPESAALGAAVAARESLLNAKAIVTDSATGATYTFSRRDMEEFWA